MSATAVQTIVITCTTTADRTRVQALIAEWSAANPGQVISTVTQSLKITVTMLTLAV